MTCPNLGVLCFLLSYVMTFVIWSHAADTKSRLVPPEIIEGPNFHEIFQVGNDRKELSCIATGTPPITYKWIFNGVEVHPRNRSMMILEGRLYINNPTRDKEGYYQCLASNPAGVAMSNVTFLQAAVFESLSARERLSVRDLWVTELDHVVLPCSHIIRSVPRDIVTWELSTDGGIDFRPVQLGDQVTQAQNGSLVFSFVRRDNSAIYKCVSDNYILRKNIGGSKVNLIIETEETSVMERKLKEPPVLLYVSPDVTVLEGEELRLECLFGAWPVHEVEWKTPLRVTNVSHAWVIPEVSVADAGVYSCLARKMADLHKHLLSAPVFISVQVDAIPSFATPLDNQEVPDSGRDVTFRCQGRGRPSPKVTWYTNGISVDKLEDVLDHSISGDGPTSVLVLKNIRTSATVTCNISNAHGYRLQSAFITIGDPESDADNKSTSSSHDMINTPQMTSRDNQPSTRPYQMTTQTYRQYQSSIPSYHRSTTYIDAKINNTNNAPESHVVDNPLSSVTTTIIIAASVGAIVVVVTVVIIIIIIKQRRRRGGFSVTEQDPQLQVELRVHNEQYDSDDSGFDDPKAEHERRALQGHQPSS